MYKIGPLKKENITLIYTLMSEPNNVSALHTNVVSLEEWQKVFAESEKDTDEENFIVFSNDIPCGWLKINGLQNKDTAWISMLVVAEEFKHQGVGKFATEFAVTYLKQRGYKQIKVQTTEDNLTAIKLYNKCGFIVANQSLTKIIMCIEV